MLQPKSNFRDVESEKEDANPILEMGKWVFVQYEGELFPGTITQVCRIFWQYRHVNLWMINPESYSVILFYYAPRLQMVGMKWTP